MIQGIIQQGILQHSFEELNHEKYKPLQRRGELEPDANDIQIVSLNVLATLSPIWTAPPQPLYVPVGFGFYWIRAQSNGWTDNKDNGTVREAEGWDFEDGDEYIKPARRAQLVGIKSDKSSYFSYERILNASLGGDRWYVNREDQPWTIYWYMNDDVSYYGDNNGTMNCEFAIRRA